MTENDKIRRATIAGLNDQVRKNVGLSSLHFHATNPHRVVMTAGISALPPEDQLAIWKQIRAIDAFTADNNPHGERDFGTIEHRGETIFWKIDYYDRALQSGSEDPADPEQTRRVLTTMLASEY